MHCALIAGYRPILDAMGSFAGATGTADIEDLSSKLCPKTHQPCKAPGRVCAGSKADGGTVWFAAKTVADIFTVFAQFPGKSVKLIGADTGRGMYVCTYARMLEGGWEGGCICSWLCAFIYLCMHE